MTSLGSSVPCFNLADPLTVDGACSHVEAYLDGQLDLLAEHERSHVCSLLAATLAHRAVIEGQLHKPPPAPADAAPPGDGGEAKDPVAAALARTPATGVHFQRTTSAALPADDSAPTTRASTRCGPRAAPEHERDQPRRGSGRCGRTASDGAARAPRGAAELVRHQNPPQTPLQPSS